MKHRYLCAVLLLSAVLLSGGCTFQAVQEESTAFYSGSVRDELYQAIYSALLDNREAVTVSGAPDADLLSGVCMQITQDHPEIFWFDGWSGTTTDSSKTDIAFAVSGQLPASERSSMQQELTESADTVLAGIPAGADDFEKALYVHDYLVANTVYSTEDAQGGSAYGCLVSHTAYCEGYSRAFLLLMNRLGIRAGICTGTAKDANHAWNYIMLGGDYYWVDVTWDDPVMETPGDELLCHYYCFISDEMLDRTHQLGDTQLFVPECSSMEMNYYMHTGRYLADYDRASALALFEAQIRQQAPALELMFASEDALNAAVQDLFDGQHFWDITDLPSDLDYCSYSVCPESAALHVALIFQASPEAEPAPEGST